MVNSKGSFMGKLIKELSHKNIKLNITSVYKSSQTTIEQARIDSIRQQRFIALISDPIYPENEWFYWRHKAFITSILIFIIGYVLTRFILGMTENEDG